MQIEIRTDRACAEPKVVIYTAAVSDEVNAIVRKLSEEEPSVIAGFKDELLEIIEQQDILRVYASAGRVVASTARGEYVVRRRLYELEQQLDKRCFARISNSEIINLKKVRGFDLSFAGTICVSLTDGATTYVSRRYVSKLKQILGI